MDKETFKMNKNATMNVWAENFVYNVISVWTNIMLEIFGSLAATEYGQAPNPQADPVFIL